MSHTPAKDLLNTLQEMQAIHHEVGRSLETSAHLIYHVHAAELRQEYKDRCYMLLICAWCKQRQSVVLTPHPPENHRSYVLCPVCKQQLEATLQLSSS